jgi:hypothetical protein
LIHPPVKLPRPRLLLVPHSPPCTTKTRPGAITGGVGGRDLKLETVRVIMRMRQGSKLTLAEEERLIQAEGGRMVANPGGLPMGLKESEK